MNTESMDDGGVYEDEIDDSGMEDGVFDKDEIDDGGNDEPEISQTIQSRQKMIQEITRKMLKEYGTKTFKIITLYKNGGGKNWKYLGALRKSTDITISEFFLYQLEFLALKGDVEIKERNPEDGHPIEFKIKNPSNCKILEYIFFYPLFAYK